MMASSSAGAQISVRCEGGSGVDSRCATKHVGHARGVEDGFTREKPVAKATERICVHRRTDRVFRTDHLACRESRCPDK